MERIVISGRIEPLKLATLIAFYKSQGIEVGNKSKLLNRIITDYVEALLNSNLIRVPETQEETKALLEFIQDPSTIPIPDLFRFEEREQEKGGISANDLINAVNKTQEDKG